MATRSWFFIKESAKIHRYNYRADVVELVDTLALGASALGREGSSPFIRTRLTGQGPAFLVELISSIISVNGTEQATLQRRSGFLSRG